MKETLSQRLELVEFTRSSCSIAVATSWPRRDVGERKIRTKPARNQPATRSRPLAEKPAGSGNERSDAWPLASSPKRASHGCARQQFLVRHVFCNEARRRSRNLLVADRA